MADTAETLNHLENALDTLEFIDSTTGLYNRKKLIQDIHARIGVACSLAACAIRIGNYERIRETLDLSSAELLAKEVARRLCANLTDGTPLYRAGGADFIFLAEVDTSEKIAARVKAVIDACCGPLDRDIGEIEPVLFAGVAVFPDDSQQTDELVDHALAAAALATEDAKVRFHSPKARRAAMERLHLEQELRRALAQDEFVLHYQPVIDLAAGRAIGAEALIRWQHPERGLIAPGKFIGAAEACGLIDPIGLWVMRRACSEARNWAANGHAGLSVAVNLSARQFLDPKLIGFVEESISDSGIAPDQLEIELTETAAMADHDYTRNTFSKLRDLGVKIAIDDFGTGYASISYLRKLPFDKLKIDREFVTDVDKARDRQAICEAMIALGHGLGLRVLAEGTETEDEVRYLVSRGCHLYQGFYFSKPLAAEAMVRGLGEVSLAAAAMRMRQREETRPPFRRALAS